MKRGLVIVTLVGFVFAAVAMAEDQAAAAAPAAAKATHVLAIKDGVASYCTCAADCKCTVAADNAAKCTCGKDIEKVDLAGKFVCEKCLVVADAAGKCAKCAADLVEVKAKAPEAK